MWCKKCNIVMSITGTTYERKKNKNGENKNFLHRRYCQCPRCNGKVYNNSENFQEILKEGLQKKKSGDNKKKKE